MNQTNQHTLLRRCIAEFIGTGLLIFFGVGCVAALVLAGAQFGQWKSALSGVLAYRLPFIVRLGFLARTLTLQSLSLWPLSTVLIKRKCYLTSFHKWLVRFVRRHWSTSCTAIFYRLRNRPQFCT